MTAGQRGDFGDLLRSHRRAAGLTQEELAERSGLSVRAVGDMERGRTARPYLRSARMLADALSLTDLARKDFFASAAADGAGARRGPGPAVAGPTMAELAADYAARRAADGAQWLVPRQLPAGPAHFAGRAKELAALSGLTDAKAAPHIVISGTAGVGKTALAVRWAQQAAGQFPDGQLYVNLRGFGPSGTPVPPTAVLRGFFAALGVTAGRIPPALDDQAAMLRSLLADKRVLMLLDNARDAEQVRPLLPGSGGCQVVVTSRDPLLALVAAEGAHPVRLDLLGTDEARKLLAGRLGHRHVAADEQSVGALIEACARLPLALSIAAARAAAHPEFSIAALVAELRDTEDRLDVLDAWDPATSVRAVFSWSYQHLTGPAARMLRLLSVHPGPDITVPAAASLAGLPRSQARRLLAELTRTQLLSEHVPGRFSCHDLLRAYAAERLRELDDEAGQQSALRRMLDHYLHTAHAADRQLYPAREPLALAPPESAVQPEEFPDRPEVFSWYQAEDAVLRGVIGLAAQAGEHAYVWQLPRAMETYLVWQGQWHELAALVRGGLEAARRLGDLPGQAYSVRALGRASGLLGRHDEASRHVAEALGFFRALGDRIGEARTHIDAGCMADREGRFGEALDHARRALELYSQAGFRPGPAGALNNLGWYQAKLGDYAQAQASCQQALALFRELGDRYGAAHALDSLALAHRRLGGYARSIACYQESLELFRATGSRIDQAEVLSRLADCQHAAGDLPCARASWRQALSLLDEGHRPAAARSAPGTGRILQFEAAG